MWVWGVIWLSGDEEDCVGDKDRSGVSQESQQSHFVMVVVFRSGRQSEGKSDTVRIRRITSFQGKRQGYQRRVFD